MISVIIPAYNESERIAPVLEAAQEYADEIIVIDDCSTDNTIDVARHLGVKILYNEHRKGYIGAVKTGFMNAMGDIIVTLDADGEHNPSDIPRLVTPILEDRASLVLGKRREIPRISERFINWLTNFRVKIDDAGTGFRAIDKRLALKLQLRGKCTCGILVLEANHYGARIVEVPITTRNISKKRKVAWNHFWQIIFIVYIVVKLGFRNNVP